MKITDAEIEAAKSPRGGFTRKTLAAWGVPWPPVKGWRKALIEGRPIPDRRRSRSNGHRRPNMPTKPSEAEGLVFAVATFLLDRGHRDAAHDLATNPETAIAYLEQANS
jgi:hypothetical protein